MNITCPHCQKPVTVPDAAAERPTPCPACGNIFTSPALMGEPPPAAPPIAVREPAPVTASAVLAPAPAAPPIAATPKPAVVDTDRGLTLKLSRYVVKWIGPVALVLLFFLTFFRWVGSYPAGIGVVTQSAWEVMSGGFSMNSADDEVGRWKQAFETHSRFNGWMLFYLLMLIPAVLLAALELVQEHVTFKVPDAIQWIWPKRLPVLTALTAGLFLVLVIMTLGGLGLERAAAAIAQAKIDRNSLFPGSADGTVLTDKQELTLKLKRGVEYAGYAIRRTGWLRLAEIVHAAAMVGFLLHLWLTRRGKRPAPRLEVSW